MSLSPTQARRLALHHQGLLKPDPFGRGFPAVEKTINALRYVQIDTISVVNRAHHHVLQSRIGNYQQAWLNRLLEQDRKIFEYWHHAAAYLPIDHYRYYRPLMEGYAATRNIDKKVARYVLDRISQEGALQSKDFEAPPGRKSGGWWSWKPTKLALEQLFLSGKLMVSGRKGFQKVFDLTDRVLPHHIDTATPTDEERANFYVDEMLGAQGIARAPDIGYMRQVASRFEKYKIMPGILRSLEHGIESNEIVSIPINDQIYYAKTAAIEAMPKRIGKKRVLILSPFDNSTINRTKLANLFGFQYQIECYVPEPKRQYGYFTLPILLGDKFIGRIDCKAFRKEARFVINNLWLESHAAATAELAELIFDAIQTFSIQHECESVEILNVDDKVMGKYLKAIL